MFTLLHSPTLICFYSSSCTFFSTLFVCWIMFSMIVIFCGFVNIWFWNCRLLLVFDFKCLVNQFSFYLSALFSLLYSSLFKFKSFQFFSQDRSQDFGFLLTGLLKSPVWWFPVLVHCSDLGQFRLVWPKDWLFL